MFHSRGNASSIDLPFLSLRSLTTLTFQFPLAWTHSRVRRTFSGASTCPGATSPPPRMHWGLSTCLNLLMQRGLVICSCLCSLRARRTLNLFSPTPARGEEVFFNLFSPTPARGEEVLKTLSYTLDRQTTMRVLELCASKLCAECMWSKFAVALNYARA